jgi:hypothetical protein
MDTSVCLGALEDALRKGRPEIFNTDQGAQFTSAVFTDKLEAAGVRISMDGRGRWLDNVFVERLWRSLKYEEVRLKAYANGLEARIAIGQWFRFYNERRPPGLGLQDSGDGVGGRGEPCGFAAALGRCWRVAHNSTGPTTAKRGTHLTRKRSGLHLTSLLPWSHNSGPPLHPGNILNEDHSSMVSRAGQGGRFWSHTRGNFRMTHKPLF